MNKHSLLHNSNINAMAQAGLIAKGFVYVLLGAIGFMAAFEINNQQDSEANRNGALHTIREWPAGPWLLSVMAAGLLCYTAWRLVQASRRGSSDKKKDWAKRLRYAFSGLVYLSLAVSAVRMIFFDPERKNDQNQYWASEIMSKPFGQILLGIGALVMAGIGIYQAWYGLSGKYRKHVEKLQLHSTRNSLLLQSGKIGYVARGIVWLVIAFLLLRAALHANASEAGDTGKAFQFIESSAFGSALLGLTASGLIAYGVFNFVRARFERFE